MANLIGPDSDPISDFADSAITTFVPISVRRQVHTEVAALFNDAEKADASHISDFRLTESGWRRRRVFTN